MKRERGVNIALRKKGTSNLTKLHLLYVVVELVANSRLQSTSVTSYDTVLKISIRHDPPHV